MKLQLIRLGSLLMLVSAAMVGGFNGCASIRGDAAQLEDRRLVSRVEHALRRDMVYKFSDVKVSAANGAVQLSGFIPSEKARQRAEEIARRVDGVNQVVNKIVVQ